MTVNKCDKCGKIQIFPLHQIRLTGGVLSDEIPRRKCRLLFRDGYGGTDAIEICTDCARALGEAAGFTVEVIV